MRGVPNGPPVGVNDAFNVVENTSLNVAAPGLLANDSDPDGDPIEVSGVIQPANGLVQSSPAGSFAYTPDPGFTGVDTFLYEVEDDNGNSTGLVVQVSITVTPTSPDPPAPDLTTTAATTTTDDPPTTVVVTTQASTDGPQAADPEPLDGPAPVADVSASAEPVTTLDPDVTTTSVSTGTLPATGSSSSVLVVAGAVVALGAGALVSALGTAATEGLRRSARPGLRNRGR